MTFCPNLFKIMHWAPPWPLLTWLWTHSLLRRRIWNRFSSQWQSWAIMQELWTKILRCFEHTCVLVVNEEQWLLPNVILAGSLHPPHRAKEPSIRFAEGDAAMMFTMWKCGAMMLTNVIQPAVSRDKEHYQTCCKQCPWGSNLYRNNNIIRNIWQDTSSVTCFSLILESEWDNCVFFQTARTTPPATRKVYWGRNNPSLEFFLLLITRRD